MAQRRAGITFFKVDGERFDVKGTVTYDIAASGTREAIVGADGVHGFKEMPRAPFIELTITDGVDVDLAALSAKTNSTVMVELASGKVIVLRDAFQVGVLEGNSEEGEVSLRFEGKSASEI